MQRNLIYASPRAEGGIRFDDDQEESLVAQNIIIGRGIKLKHRNAILNNIIIGGGISIRPETIVGAEVRHNIIVSTATPRRSIAARCNRPRCRR